MASPGMVMGNETDMKEFLQIPPESFIPIVTHLCERKLNVRFSSFATEEVTCIELTEEEPIPEPTSDCRNVLTHLRCEHNTGPKR